MKGVISTTKLGLTSAYRLAYTILNGRCGAAPVSTLLSPARKQASYPSVATIAWSGCRACQYGKITTRGLTSRRTRTIFLRFSSVFSIAPSGRSSASRRLTPSRFAASAASRARSSAVPRVPASPRVKSRIAVRSPRAAIRSSVPPQVCSTSSRCAAIASTSARPSASLFGIVLVDGVIAVEVRIHKRDVRCRSAHRNVLIVDRRTIRCVEDVHLPTLRHVDLVQPCDCCYTRQIAQVGLQQRNAVVAGVEHGQASIRLSRRVTFAVGALGHADPQRVVVGHDHAARSARRAIADRDRSSCR